MARETKAKFDIDAGGIFKGIGGVLGILSDMMEKGEEKYSETGELKIPGLSEDARGVYGFSIKMGLGGKPTVERFGNIKETEKGIAVEEVREPLTDIIVEEERILVVAELPGIEQEKIKIDVEGDILKLEAENAGKRYAKEILLPSAVEKTPAKTSYKNGILEIIFSKKQS
ncbi:MAG: Hsp20 family protein [Chloroflexi bacterium]|nr:Hsp20 family protein [Chloroflexota bacterium]